MFLPKKSFNRYTIKSSMFLQIKAGLFIEFWLCGNFAKFLGRLRVGLFLRNFILRQTFLLFRRAKFYVRIFLKAEIFSRKWVKEVRRRKERANRVSANHFALHHVSSRRQQKSKQEWPSREVPPVFQLENPLKFASLKCRSIIRCWLHMTCCAMAQMLLRIINKSSLILRSPLNLRCRQSVKFRLHRRISKNRWIKNPQLKI